MTGLQTVANGQHIHTNGVISGLAHARGNWPGCPGQKA
jgi:hypothetical protein